MDGIHLASLSGSHFFLSVRTPLYLLFFPCRSSHSPPSLQAVAALAIDKVGPRPYHFHSGPTTRPGSKKSKFSVVHNLAVLKGHPESLKCGKTLWRPRLRPGSRWGQLTALPQNPYLVVLPPSRELPPLSALRASNFGPSVLALCLPKSVYQNPPMQ